MCAGLLVGLTSYVMVMPDRRVLWDGLRGSLAGGDLRTVLDNPLWNLASIALSSLLITLVGLADDVLDIRPKQKVLGQVLAAGILLLGGVGNRMAIAFFSAAGLDAAPGWILVPLSGVLCIVIVILTCNATNLLDGLDGLCGGVTGIIALGFLALSVWLVMFAGPGEYARYEVRVVLCLAMAGAVLGFLPYNIPPATIFMGDAGSMLLGFFVATMMALFCMEGKLRWFIAAWAVFALPTLDTGLAVVRRLLSGQSIFTGDRSHLYDQLVDRGMKVKQVVGLFYILGTVAAVVGVVLAIFVRARYAIIVYLVALAAAALLFWRAGMVTPPSKRTPPGSDHEPTAT